MNLHGIVSGAVATVNPIITVTIRVNSGSYITNADGSRVPNYNVPISVQAQVQPLQYNDIVLADGMNVQGIRKKIYINGVIDGLVRSKDKGGDLITMPDGSIYKIAVIVEAWPDWTAAIIVLQDNA